MGNCEKSIRGMYDHNFVFSNRPDFWGEKFAISGEKMDIFLVSNGWNKNPLAFSSWKKAEQKIFENFRTSKCTHLSIDQVTVDYGDKYEYKYQAEHKIAGNLHFLSVTLSGKIVLHEIITMFHVDSDRDLVYSQLQEYSDSSPQYIYFNDRRSVKRGQFRSDVVGKIQKVKDPEVLQHFTYKAFCCASNRTEKKQFPGGF